MPRIELIERARVAGLIAQHQVLVARFGWAGIVHLARQCSALPGGKRRTRRLPTRRRIGHEARWEGAAGAMHVAFSDHAHRDQIFAPVVADGDDFFRSRGRAFELDAIGWIDFAAAMSRAQLRRGGGRCGVTGDLPTFSRRSWTRFSNFSRDDCGRRAVPATSKPVAAAPSCDTTPRQSRPRRPAAWCAAYESEISVK